MHGTRHVLPSPLTCAKIAALGCLAVTAGCSSGTLPSASPTAPTAPGVSGTDRVALSSDGHAVSAARAAGVHAAGLHLVSGTDRVVVTTADLGDGLFRASTPVGSRQLPRVNAAADGTVTVSLVDATGGGPAEVDIVLSSAVVWSVSLDGGAAEEKVDLTGARVSALNFIGGGSSISALLPAPSGDVAVRMTGGTSSFHVQTPAGAPTRVSFGGGAGTATVDGSVVQGVAGGTVMDAPGAPGWSTAEDRYTIDNSAGVSAFTLTRG